MSKARMIEVLKNIEADMANDATAFDGKPFNGRTVAEYFGNQGAALASVASILAIVIQADLDRLAGVEDLSPFEQARFRERLGIKSE